MRQHNNTPFSVSVSVYIVHVFTNNIISYNSNNTDLQIAKELIKAGDI